VITKTYAPRVAFGYFSIVILYSFALVAGSENPLSLASELATPDSLLSVNVLDRQVDMLKEERKNVSELSPLSQRLTELVGKQKALSAELKNAGVSTKEFLNKKLGLITQDNQVLTELEQVRSRYLGVLSDHIKLLEEYKTDPEFTKFTMPIKASYNFDEFEELGRKIFYIRQRLADYEQSQRMAFEDYQKLKKAQAALEEEARDKKKLQERFAERAQEEGIDPQQTAELIDLEKRLIDDKSQLIKSKIQEADQRTILLDTEIMTVKSQLAKLIASYEQVKAALYIDEKFLKDAEEEVSKKRQEYALDTERMGADIARLNTTKTQLEHEFETAAQKLNVSKPDAVAYAEWSKTPQTIQEWNAACGLGSIALKEAITDVEREYKNALIDLEWAKLKTAEIHLDIIRSWNVISKRRLGMDTALGEQIKAYEAPKNEILSYLSSLQEKRARTLGRLQQLNTMFDHIKKLTGLIRDDKIDFEMSNLQDFKVCMLSLRDPEEQARRRLYRTAKLVETYSTAIAQLEEAVKRIENVVSELGSKSFWRRSDQSITMSELKNFWPDLRRFYEDIKTGIKRFIKNLSFRDISVGLFGVNSLLSFILLLLRTIMLFLLFWALRFYLPELQTFLARKPTYFVRTNIRLFGAVALNFIINYFAPLYVWSVLHILIATDFITNNYFAVFFYLCSIPFMLWLAFNFFQYLFAENQRLGYAFISPSYLSRFLYIVPTLVYLTIGLFFFRTAFKEADYHSPAVPAILKAVNFILFQLSLMALISKEWVLSWIPQTSLMWEWVYEKINQYYYLFWLAIVTIIIMSNPYVGYGRQVWFVLSRIFVISLLIPLLIFLYGKLRRGTVDLFFYSTEGETVRERFVSARMIYAFFIAIAFLVFVALGVVLGINILGYSFTLKDMYSWLEYELYPVPTTDPRAPVGKVDWITPLQFLKFFSSFVIGLLVAYVFNRLFLKRVFDPLLISGGIQNTIFTLSRYIIVFIAILLGMRSIGLSSIANTLALVAGIIGFAFRDPLNDLFSYFIILVQRPIKIGDLIQLENGTQGVVRHITPRSTIIRHLNSTSIVVPNSYFISRMVTNWNYSQTFSAIPDISLTFGYKYDPIEIKAIIFKVLDSNPNLLKSPTPVIRLEDFTDIGNRYLVRPFISNDKVHERMEIASNVRIELIRALKEANIQMADSTRLIRLIRDFERLSTQDESPSDNHK